MVRSALQEMKFMRESQFREKFAETWVWKSKKYFGRRVLRFVKDFRIPKEITRMRFECSELNGDRYKYKSEWQKRLKAGWCACSSYHYKVEETPKHFFFQCGRFVEERRDFLERARAAIGFYPTTGTILGEDTRINQEGFREFYRVVEKYCEDTGRFDHGVRHNPDLGLDGFEGE